MEKSIVSLEDLAHEAQVFVRGRTPKKKGATLVTLSGDLGAGKTAFVQAVARVLGSTEHITSPTFVLLKTYPVSQQQFSRLAHIDAYRLNGKEELASLGLQDLLLDPKTIIMFEWPERVAGGLPDADTALTLTLEADGSRTLSYA